MKGFIWRLIFILALLVGGIGLFLLFNRPLGVAVDCDGTIEGFGAPGLPLGNYESGCSAEVEVKQGNQTVCTGEGKVKGERSIIACPGIADGDRSKSFRIEANFSDSSGAYAKDSGQFSFN
jgi:hypothetical protein